MPGGRIPIISVADRPMPFFHLSPTGNRRQRFYGFTLIEVMVVVVIMGMLAALVVPRLMERTDEIGRAHV